MNKDDMGTVELLVLTIGLVGGLNWLLVDAAQFNLVTEVAGTNSGIIYTAIGAAGAVSLGDLYGVLDLEDIGGGD